MRQKAAFKLTLPQTEGCAPGHLVQQSTQYTEPNKGLEIKPHSDITEIMQQGLICSHQHQVPLYCV